ncbi:sensor histidine kinase [Streptomyces sp. NBC_00083]|uniref:sensor histidine kinase n=1 Tax=Streptomyces sp. NBC_00083 TaxID=2975647 RepID=UPI00225AF77D|nr:histidine kinase [Streptomyces sp. NBC_00083]MCX5383170.1 histidine kinase [Streptomyces sp. NBC_00083]
MIRTLFDARARLRWVHLVIGGALLMPYFLVGTVVVGAFGPGVSPFDSFPLAFVTFAVSLPFPAVTALVPIARPLLVFGVRTLCAVDPGTLADRPARSWDARLRAAAWYTLHVGVGGILSGMSLALPPFAVFLIVLPAFPGLRSTPYGATRPLATDWGVALAPLAGITVLLGLAACSAAAGALLARLAPVLLGPTPADRLAAAEQRAAELAVRNRLARELHDAVGHALSAVTLQAGAARRVLDDDREFVREALTAIEETARRTVDELDAVLGLLRQDDTDLATPGLAGLGELVARTGLEVAYVSQGDPASVPELVSREAYRIVQEGLSNAVRHGSGARAVTLRVSMGGGELEILMENPVSGATPVVRPGGGRGLRGMAERAALLGGRVTAGPEGGAWRLRVSLPLGGGR